ncbi:hypothetical protein MWU78_00395 [Arenibacter sp. F26102]|uniref:inositol monophosphatase family protein n=1 Tax=Arenibacter sp. F26102 TaxID=2926416 RepID=UPI001FF46CEF|nr:inositol monophosphatase family protein [Arenibacter sp. F26102]MCK0144103.1 hypothetical protein [Arenibacter sp. F26102]
MKNPLSISICTEIKELIEINLNLIIELRSKKTLKADGSYVSEGDLLCESLIKGFLKKKYPKIWLVSEESPIDNVENIKKDEVLILDPIDGTENFVSGLMEWGMAICYYKNGQHIESMLALPELRKYLKTGDKIETIQSRICGISSSLTKEDILKLKPGFEYRIIGCCVYNMLNVVNGSFNSFENPKGAYIWDIIPGLNLALENGLNVVVNNKKYNGELLSPNDKYTFKITRN